MMHWRKLLRKLSRQKDAKAEDFRRVIEALKENHVSQEKIREMVSPEMLQHILPELKHKQE